MMATRTERAIPVMLEELHSARTGRINAVSVATFLAVSVPKIAAALGASTQAVHKTPDAPSLQPGLAPLKRALELISEGTRTRREALAWLNSAHPDLGGETPIQVLLRGQADAVVTLLENALAGLPS